MSLLDALALSQSRGALPTEKLLEIAKGFRWALKETEWNGIFEKMAPTIDANLGHVENEIRRRGSELISPA